MKDIEGGGEIDYKETWGLLRQGDNTTLYLIVKVVVKTHRSRVLLFIHYALKCIITYITHNCIF